MQELQQPSAQHSQPQQLQSAQAVPQQEPKQLDQKPLRVCRSTAQCGASAVYEPSGLR